LTNILLVEAGNAMDEEKVKKMNVLVKCINLKWGISGLIYICTHKNIKAKEDGL
jgi:hypothetical protein